MTEHYIGTEAVKEMNFDQAKEEMQRRIYQAALFFETLEHAGKVRCNGHHQAQKIAKMATDELTQIWVGEKPDLEKRRETLQKLTDQAQELDMGY